MLSLRNPPDFAALARTADRLSAMVYVDPTTLQSVGAERREVFRQRVCAPLYTGVVPKSCDKLPLSRIPVSVFKPLDAGWALDVSTRGLAWLATLPTDPETRLWLGLHAFASKPTVLPVRVTSCQQIEPGVFRVGCTYTMRPADIAQRLCITHEQPLELRIAS